MVFQLGRKKDFRLNNKNVTIWNQAWLDLAFRWFLGAIFVYASWHKMINPAYFAKIIYGYYLFPEYSINLMAITIPFIEFVSGVALIFGIYPRSAILIIMGMLLAFIIALSINLVRGHEFDCGCFSFGEPGYSSSSEQLIVRDIIYFITGMYVLFYNKERRLCILQNGSIIRNYK